MSLIDWHHYNQTHLPARGLMLITGGCSINTLDGDMLRGDFTSVIALPVASTPPYI
jgi:hypothetical protein